MTDGGLVNSLGHLPNVATAVATDASFAIVGAGLGTIASIML